MMVISIVTQKGGSGKTATAAALIAGLQREGLRVLATDVDPQRNLTAQMGAAKGFTVLDVLTGNTTIDKALQNTPQGALIPADSRLALKGVLQGKGEEYALKKALEPLQRRFDVAVIDTPPNIGALTVAAMTASNAVIIPAVPDRHSIDALKQTAASIKRIQNPETGTNKGLRVLGVLPTMYQKRFTVHRVQLAQLAQIAGGLGLKVYDPIRYCAVVQEAEFMNQSVFDGRKGNPAAVDYGEFVKEVLQQIKND